MSKAVVKKPITKKRDTKSKVAKKRTVNNVVDVTKIPFHNIVFAATSKPDYEQDRVIFVEDYPDAGDYLIIKGKHDDESGFDTTKWVTKKYKYFEILDLLEKWTKRSCLSEKALMDSLMKYFSEI